MRFDLLHDSCSLGLIICDQCIDKGSEITMARRNVDEDSLEFDDMQSTTDVYPLEDPAYTASFTENRHCARAFIAHLTTGVALSIRPC